MTMINFTKMHGLGNDFLVLERLTQQFELSEALVGLLGDRNLGVGFDQLLLVEPPDTPEADFKYRIFNADGSEVEQCGNGARCFARFVVERGLSFKKQLVVETSGGVIYLKITDEGLVTVDMGLPNFKLESLPFVPTGSADAKGCYTLSVLGQSTRFFPVSMGNPHVVLLVDDVLSAAVETTGPALMQHKAFARQVNVGFMQVLSPTRINLRVYERGAGETQACGSGACAAVVAGVQMGLLKPDTLVTVQLHGGQLQIRWAANQPVLMSGPTERVFEGVLDMQRLQAMADSL